MSNKFWQSYRPVLRDVNVPWNRFRTASNGGIGYETLRIPPFSVVDIPFIGSSYTLLEFAYTVGEPFTLIDPVLKPSGDLDYCLAIRWGISPNITRYKLWENGEILSYPVYNREIIPESFVFEVWNVYIRSTVTQVLPLDLRTSILLERTDCCETPALIDTLTENSILFEPMNPTAALPFVPSEAFHYP